MGRNKKVTGLSILGSFNDPSSSWPVKGSGEPQSDALGESLDQGNLKRGVETLTRSPELSTRRPVQGQE